MTMTKRKRLKGRARARSAKTGESYTTALRQIRARRKGESTMSDEATTMEIAFACSFCKKSQHEVPKLIAGPGVYICNECIALCNDILTGDQADTRAPSVDEAPVDRLLNILKGTATTAGELEEQVRARARSLHARGASIEQIAEATGMTPEEAAARFDL